MPTDTVHLCFPVWNYAHLADPYMASIRRIQKRCVCDPESEAVLIGSVFDMAHAEISVGGRDPEREARHA